MNSKDAIEWLKSLKKHIGQSQHSDLWCFEQVIDEVITILEPLAKPHGDLIDRDMLLLEHTQVDCMNVYHDDFVYVHSIEDEPAIIKAEVNYEHCI